MTSFTNDTDVPGGVKPPRRHEIRLPGNHLMCCSCGRFLTEHDFDIVTPRQVRAVCQSCHRDLVSIEFA